MKKKLAKSRFYLCGIMTILILMLGFSEAIKAEEQICMYEIFHKHIAGCETTAYKTISADKSKKMITTKNDSCSNCGGHHDYYEFTASCSCGKTWIRTGHACINSPVGSYQGSCTNYSKVDTNTSHSHPYKEYSCGFTEESVIENIMVTASTLSPAKEVVLSAQSGGMLEHVVLNWEAEGETITVNENGVYHLYATYYENDIEYISDIPVEVNNIDLEPPVVDDIVASVTEFTNAEVILTVNARDNMGLPEKYVSWNGGEFDSDNTYVISENGIYEAAIIDQAGNVITKTICITNIDTAAPQIVKISTNPSKWYSGQCVVSVEAKDMGSGSDGCGLASEAYSWDGGATWVAESFIECTEPGIVKVQVRDAVGNIAMAEIEIKKLKKTSDNTGTEKNETSEESEIIDDLEDISDIEIPDDDEDISEPPDNNKENEKKEKQPNYLFLPEYVNVEEEYTIEQVIPETDHFWGSKESVEIENIKKDESHMGIMVSLLIAMAGFVILWIWYCLFNECNVYEKDGKNKEHYLGKARMHRKNKEYIIKIKQAVLDKASQRTLVIRLPIWMVKRAEYRPVKIMIGDVLIETFAEKNINIEIKL